TVAEAHACASVASATTDDGTASDPAGVSPSHDAIASDPSTATRAQSTTWVTASATLGEPDALVAPGTVQPVASPPNSVATRQTRTARSASSSRAPAGNVPTSGAAGVSTGAAGAA